MKSSIVFTTLSNVALREAIIPSGIPTARLKIVAAITRPRVDTMADHRSMDMMSSSDASVNAANGMPTRQSASPTNKVTISQSGSAVSTESIAPPNPIDDIRDKVECGLEIVENKVDQSFGPFADR
jgi:hypothetical protein